MLVRGLLLGVGDALLSAGPRSSRRAAVTMLVTGLLLGVGEALLSAGPRSSRSAAVRMGAGRPEAWAALGAAFDEIESKDAPFASGRAETSPRVVGVDDFEALRDLCRAAVCGKGTETVVDRSVRRSLVSDELQVEWSGLLDATAQAALQLGFKPNLEARLHQVVVYEEGDFFKWHRDAKKSADHVATMTVECEVTGEYGGNYGKGGHCVKFSPSDKYWLSAGPGSWCAWHTSDFHAIEKCADRRVLAVFNLCEKIMSKSQEATFDTGDDDDDDDRTVTARSSLANGLGRWLRGRRVAGAPSLAPSLAPPLEHARVLAESRGFRYAGVLLDHTYSLDSRLTLGKLRGRDAAVAAALGAALPGGEKEASWRCRVQPVEVLIAEAYSWEGGLRRDDTEDALLYARVAQAVEAVQFVPEYEYGRDDHDGYEAFRSSFVAKYGGDFEPHLAGSYELDMVPPVLSVPFRDTVWVHDRDSKAVRLRRRFMAQGLRHRQPDRDFPYLWGNQAVFGIFQYRDVAIFIDLVATDKDEADQACNNLLGKSRQIPAHDGTWYAPDVVY